MARILANGINQADLVDLINTIKTKWNAVLAKLDADATLTDDDYVSGQALAIPAGIQISGVKAIMSQGDFVTFLNDAITKFNAVLAKLDADTLAGLDNNYVSTLAVTDAVGNPAIDGITNPGTYQGCVVAVLNSWVTNFNLLLAKLDADPPAESDYVATTAIADTIVEEGARLRPRINGIVVGLFLLGSTLFPPLAGAADLFDMNTQVSVSTSIPTKIIQQSSYNKKQTVYIINNSGADIVLNTSSATTAFSLSITTGNARIPSGSYLSLPDWWGTLYGLGAGATASNVGVLKF